ncbi:unnamed protein product [Adineta steineri]|uniref:Uncharacterized protein n=2 Tax=Adineta steineri TaxID=433720 RepID=A0A814NT04_9BILA|nr:unnamed protein product [Adineta steineri]CAF1204855.1 unnamed protein product [Adineta steineri]
MVLLIILYLILPHAIYMSHSLVCYSCSGGHTCGTLFSPNSTHYKKVTSKENDPFSSCSITVTPEGLTIRDLVPSHTCRSSSYQFCCNENLCNSLPSPPLPALTSRKCAIGKCTMSDGICVDDFDYVTVLSSATESCSITYNKGVHYKSYINNCQATVKDVSHHINHLTSKPSIFCCNTPECNQEILTTVIKDSSLQCYTCDSRITGLKDCMILNESSPHVYKTKTSSLSEACATIIGREGQDAATGKKYPMFVIRTFISKCVTSKQLGKMSYGGATFEGRIECCTSHFCNTRTLNITKRHRIFSKKMLMIIGMIIGTLAVLAGIVIGGIHLMNKKKNKDKYGSCATKEPIELSELSKHKSQRSTADTYPEASAAPS